MDALIPYNMPDDVPKYTIPESSTRSVDTEPLKRVSHISGFCATQGWQSKNNAMTIFAIPKRDIVSYNRWEKRKKTGGITPDHIYLRPFRFAFGPLEFIPFGVLPALEACALMSCVSLAHTAYPAINIRSRMKFLNPLVRSAAI